MVDHRREGRAARLGDDEDAAPRVRGSTSRRTWPASTAACTSRLARGWSTPIAAARSLTELGPWFASTTSSRIAACAAGRDPPGPPCAAVPAAPAVLVVSVVGLIAERAPVPVVPACGSDEPRPRPNEPGTPEAGRAGRAERPPEPAPAECAERGLDRRDRV